VYKPRVSNAVKKYVKRSIHTNLENKIANVTSSGNTITSYGVNSNLFVVSCCPYSAISQGTGQGARIGNEIKTRACYFNFVLRPAPYSASNNPIPIPQIVMIFFGKVKNSRALQPVNSDFAKLFQTGNTSQAPYSNTLDLIATLNKDWFTIYKTLQFKIGYAQTDAVAGSNSAFEYYQNNDYKFNAVRKLNITKMMPKTFKFNDTTSQPTNDGLWMWAMCVPADGSNGASAIPISMDFNMTYVYEDA
jgi:hypothetical protein